jgi:hypothetical protein
MSITGVTQVLHAFLLGIAEGRLAVIDLTKQAPLPIQASQTPAEPENPEVAQAVAAAVESSGNSSEAPDAEVSED